MLTAEECARAWKETTRAGTVQERLIRNLAWAEYFEREACEQAKHYSEYSGKYADAVNYLTRQGIMSDGNTVLDIGCGIGGYTQEFALTASEVTALDMSKTSLAILKQNCKARGLINVKTVNSMWENYAPSTTFDTVFSAMCPAICDAEEMLRMESLAKKSCAVMTIAKGSYSAMRRGLRQRITREKLPSLSTDAVYIYNMLYALGRNPCVNMYAEETHAYLDMDEAKEKYVRYYSIFGYNDTNTVKIINEYVDEMAVEGFIDDGSVLNTALISWKVK